MRFNQAPRSLRHLLTAILLAPQHILANPQPHPSNAAGFSFNDLFARWECNGNKCGYYGQVCCPWGSTCYTDSSNQAQCSSASGGAQVTQAAGSGGYWQTYTTTWVETNLVTKTAVMSTYINGGAQATAVSCNYAVNEVQCGSSCCTSGQYCKVDSMVCVNAANGGSSAWYSQAATAGAGIRPTSSAGTTVTRTLAPTTTVAFMTPVATGANITLTEDHTGGGGGLSGGAIAGIVIGVLLGLALLGLLCFCCCVKGLLDGCLACFGMGKRKRRTTEIEETYSRHSHRTGGAGGGRTWYGAARPATRVSRRDDHSSKGKNLLGVGAGLAALWAILGLKRKRDNRHDEKSEYSYSSDYYTSASSASSDDRRTRDTRRSMSRR